MLQMSVINSFCNTSCSRLSYPHLDIFWHCLLPHRVWFGPRFAEARKLILLNYFQLAFVISKLDARWPSLLQLLFQVESAVGSLGLSLFSIPCHLNISSAAELAYLQQIAAMALPPGLFLSYCVWRTSACFKGRAFSHRSKSGKLLKSQGCIYFHVCILCFSSLSFSLYRVL